ncbi:MAG: hypothetical protein LBT79_06025 [Elusimicrobiota bacterium]|jgi:hypothetical protein|nr:hypothetical protein [Elusimicrobiota bacterium]
MKEKDKNNLIELLIEETGCEQNEAEVALSLSNGNLKEAINKVTVFLKVISAFKIKIIFPQESVYGLMNIVINKKLLKILRFNIVFSYNPAIYEISSAMDWFSFEKALFSARLSEGAMEDYTKSIQEPLMKYIEEELQYLRLPSQTIIGDFFAPLIVNADIISEELNLAQFKKIPEEEPKRIGDSSNNYKDYAVLKLEAEICQDLQGCAAQNLAAGNTVLSLITDTRDIAHYLIHLIGGYQNGTLNQIPAPVKEIIFGEDNVEIYLQYTPSVIGYAKVKKDFCVKVMSTIKPVPIWKRFLPWFSNK